MFRCLYYKRFFKHIIINVNFIQSFECIAVRSNFNAVETNFGLVYFEVLIFNKTQKYQVHMCNL